MKWIQGVFLFVFLLSQSPAYGAAPWWRTCFGLLSSGPSASPLPEVITDLRQVSKFINKSDPKAYRKFKRILILADQPVPRGNGLAAFYDVSGNLQMESLADNIATMYPKAQVVQGDIQVENKITGNLQRLKLDLRQPLPFESNSFDVVVMANGLCPCSNGVCCGTGFKPTVENLTSHMLEVARVLDLRSFDSIGFLHGPRQNGDNYSTFMEAAIVAMELRSDARFDLIKGSEGNFVAYRIQRRLVP